MSEEEQVGAGGKATSITINGFQVQESEIISVTVLRNGVETVIAKPAEPAKKIGLAGGVSTREPVPVTAGECGSAAEAKCAEYRDTFTAANEMRLSGVRLRQAVQQRAELAEMRCTEALDRLEVANQQLAELLAANERMRAAMNDIDAYVRDIRHGATFADSMRDTIIITIRQALAAAETGVAK